ncbi:MAG: co-chaperone GroES [Candidatus Eremiobacterota bacterium]
MATKTLTLKPLADRIVITPIEQDEKTAGGVYLPDTAKEKPMKGKVVAVGPGRLLKDGTTAKMEIELGMTVLYGKYTGTEVKLHGDNYVILQERDVLAIFE